MLIHQAPEGSQGQGQEPVGFISIISIGSKVRQCRIYWQLPDDEVSLPGLLVGSEDFPGE